MKSEMYVYTHTTLVQTVIFPYAWSQYYGLLKDTCYTEILIHLSPSLPSFLSLSFRPFLPLRIVS